MGIYNAIAVTGGEQTKGRSVERRLPVQVLFELKEKQCKKGTHMKQA